MIKMIFMLKRRPGMSVAEFRDYYERNHARLGEKHVPNAARYVRRFLDPVATPFNPVDADYDCVTELWFDTQEEVDIAMKRLSDPAVFAEIAADEENIFDRPRTRVYTVTERESDLAALRAAATA